MLRDGFGCGENFVVAGTWKSDLKTLTLNKVFEEMAVSPVDLDAVPLGFGELKVSFKTNRG